VIVVLVVVVLPEDVVLSTGCGECTECAECGVSECGVSGGGVLSAECCVRGAECRSAECWQCAARREEGSQQPEHPLRAASLQAPQVSEPPSLKILAWFFCVFQLLGSFR
jgi:hypothetical protein